VKHLTLMVILFCLLVNAKSFALKSRNLPRKFAIKMDSSTTSSSGNTAVPLLHHLNGQCSVILASSSPRRKELLTLMGVHDFRIMKSDFEEDLDHALFPSASSYCLGTAVAKASDVVTNLEKLSGLQKRGTILIGADTVVEINGKILEKPKDAEDAYDMISMLSGNPHIVHTAVTVFGNGRPDKSETGQLIAMSSFVESTSVKFVLLAEADKRAYVESREGFDKAGGYGIQGLGGQMVEKIDGCYFNVMGFPLSRLSRELALLYRSEKI
jgi:septum formation protein